MQLLEQVLHALKALPAWLIYLILGAGAATENIVPPVPADTFVLVGALLSAGGAATVWIVFLVTWLSNVLSAIAVYALARRYGRAFFKMPVARWLLREHQLEQIGAFYLRLGIPAIFFSRFLPAFRAMVPVFAGVSRMRAIYVIPPTVLASGIWYGFLVYLGAFMGHNLGTIGRIFGRINNILLWLAIVVIAIVLVWWWRTRRHPEEE